MKICITVGHSLLKNGSYTSANGFCNEYKWNRTFVKNLRNQLKKKHDVTVIVCPEKVFTLSAQEKDYKLQRCNAKYYDLIIELHLNSSTAQSANGCEVLYKTEKGKFWATAVQKQLCSIFRNRGIKKRDDLYMLNGTKAPTIILETFFCTSKTDYKKAKGLANRRKIAKAIAKGINNA